MPYAKMDDPQSLNLYAYVGNNPLRGVDHDGHDFLTTDPTEMDNSEAETESSQSVADQQQAQQQNNEIAGQINHETLGMKDSKTENESLASAEDKIAHVSRQMPPAQGAAMIFLRNALIFNKMNVSEGSHQSI